MFEVAAHSVNCPARPLHVAYVLKRYPRFSETFVVNEILAHERAGTRVSIFALRPPADTHFQPAIARVRAPVTYLQSVGVRADDFWQQLSPHLAGGRWQGLGGANNSDGIEVFQALQLSRLLCDAKVDHIHAHFATSAAAVARIASGLTGIPYSFTAHAKDIYHENVDPDDLARKLADAKAVVTVSDFNRQYLERHFPNCADKLHRIYNGLPLDEFVYLRAESRLPVILAIGRLVEKKGFGDLVAACALLARLDVPFRCDVIGGGELEIFLRRQIASLGLESHVRMLGPQPSDAVVGALRRAAVLAVPCVTASTGDRDGLPTVLLEAMALGTPCIATEVTGIPEVVRNEETGLLVPERSPERLAGAIRRLLSNQQLAGRLQANARRLIEQQFDVDRNAAELRKHFAASDSHSASAALFAEAV